MPHRPICPCISFILVRDQRLLVEQRCQHKRTDPGCLTIPGGHVEPHESLTQALLRECYEELGIKVLQYQLIDDQHHSTGIEIQHIHYFWVQAWSGEPQAFEAHALHWMPLEAPNLDLKADRQALNKLHLWRQTLVCE